MRKLLCVVVLALLPACGPPTVPSVEKSLEPYVLSFKDRTGVTPRSDIVFSVLEGTTVGLCEVWTDGYTKVTVDPTYFAKLSEEQREELVYHELGHCELSRKHDSTMTTKAGKYVPESVMYPYVFSLTQAQVYGNFRSEYIQELLSGN